MYKNKYITGILSPTDFFKMDAGAVIYYEVDHKETANYGKAQRFITGKASASKIKITQTKILNVEPDSMQANLLIKVKFVERLA